MNNIFNLQRFGLLLKRQWLEFGKIYLITLLVIIGVLLTAYTYYYKNITGGSHYSTNAMSFRVPYFLVTGFLFTTVLSSTYFAHLGQKSRAVIDLMIPASTFEKFMAGLFYTILLGIGMYFFLFYVIDLIYITKLRDWHLAHPAKNELASSVQEFFPYFYADKYEHFPKALYFIPIIINSIFLLGSIYFNRYHYIKTAITVILFSGIWTYIIIKAGQFLYEGRVLVAQSNFEKPSQNTIEFGLLIAMLIPTLIVWYITYVRLKEKQV
jgi:hypothetical protein